MILFWKFRNGHIWSQPFSNVDEMYSFIYRVGLTLHPDIISVWSEDNDNKQTIIF